MIKEASRMDGSFSRFSISVFYFPFPVCRKISFPSTMSSEMAAKGSATMNMTPMTRGVMATRETASMAMTSSTMPKRSPPFLKSHEPSSVSLFRQKRSTKKSRRSLRKSDFGVSLQFGLNLRLASRALGGEPVFPFSAARSAAESVGQKAESLILVGYSKNSANLFRAKNVARRASEGRRRLLGKIKEAKRLRAEAQEAAQNLLPAELHRIFTPTPKNFGVSSQSERGFTQQHTTPHKQHTNKLEYVRMSGKWEEKELGEICEKVSNIKWGNDTNKDFKYIDLTSVSREDFSIAETKENNSKNAPSRAKKVVKANDVIFGTTRPTLMRVTVIPEEFNNHICSTGFAVLRAKKERVLSQFIYYFIRSERFMNRMGSVQTGASYPAVSDTKVLETKIPLPPVEKQKKIVARLDSLSEKIKTLREYQKSTASDFTSLEQSILSKSFQHS